jgi:benzodiazapine receptor
MKKVFGILGSVLICECAGLIGSLFTRPSIAGWYAGLSKPSFSPPNWVFAPVWTVLYAMMGIAAYLVYEKGFKRPDVRKALAFFAVQLVVNVLWSIVFFGAHSLLGGVIVILPLWALILVTIMRFSPLSKTAGYLLVPYFLWVSFATALTISYAALNR